MTLATLLRDSIPTLWARPATSGAEPTGTADFADAPADVRRLIRERRYCQMLTGDTDVPFDDDSLTFAWRAVAQFMALVPGGDVTLASGCAVSTGGGLGITAAAPQRESVAPLYIDRYPVTNAEYARFVAAGGYADAQLWPQEILANVLQLVDRTGHPGPKDWRDGQPPPGKEHHPVVGICWFEANAYAHWAAKRLPTSAQWQRAATWSTDSSDAAEAKYPWGNAFDPSRANTWSSRRGDTVAVDALVEGRTPGGVHQLIGNVWEWIDGQFSLASEAGVDVWFDQTMAEIRGGAFDTYFPSQATCQFRSGLALAARRSNVGFRCCVSGDRLPTPPDPQVFLGDRG